MDNKKTIMIPSGVRRNHIRTSPLWQMFKRLSPGLARCCVCKKTLSYKSSNTNLKRHLLSRHYAAFEKMLGHSNSKGTKPSDEPVTNLIALVKKHPCLWDTQSDSYADEQKQHEAWNKIASELYPLEEQGQVVTKISDQFNILRNGFFSNRLCGYSNELSFMAPTLYRNDGEIPFDNHILDDTIDETTSEKVDLVTNDLNQSGFTKKYGINEFYKHKGGRPKKNIQQAPEEAYKLKIHSVNSIAYSSECNLQFNDADEDTLFLLSLVDQMRKIPEEYEMNFKAELLSEFSKQLKRYEDKS